MPRKPKLDNPEQFKRFIKTAREAEADESPDALDRAFNKVMGRPQETATRARPVQNRSRQNRDGEDSQR